MRKHWLDNLRWVTVLLVLFYPVIYFFKLPVKNSKIIHSFTTDFVFDSVDMSS